MMKRTAIILVALILLISGIGQAEFVCNSDVKYRWRKDENKEFTVYWAMLEKRGVDENAAKSGLSDAANRERAKALEHCQKEHQNTSGCIASRLESSQPILAKLSFASRKKLEESIVTDCALKQGECVAVDLTEAVCKDLNPPAPEETKDEKKSKGKSK